MNNATYTWRNIKNLSVCSCSCKKIILLSTLKLKNKLVDGWRTTKWSWNGHKHFVFSDLYVICNKSSIFTHYSIRFCFINKEYLLWIIQIFALHVYPENSKGRNKTYKNVTFCIEKNPDDPSFLQHHDYTAKWNNFICSLIKSNSLLLFT